MKQVLSGWAAVVMALATHQASAQLYLRGDVGAAFAEPTEFTDVTAAAPNAALGPGVKVSGDVGDSVILAGGIGFRWTPAFRTDLTLSYMPSLKFTGHDNLGLGSTSTADFKPLVGLVNGYVDFNGLVPGGLGRFQPYMGFGVGVSRNHLGTFNTNVSGTNLAISGASHTAFAWSGTAGLAYKLTDHVLLDFSYRYFDIGETRSGTSATAAGVTVPVGAVKADIDIHAVSLGARFEF